MSVYNTYTGLKIERILRLDQIAREVGRHDIWPDSVVDAVIENLQDDRELEAWVERGNLAHEQDLWDLEKYEEEERANH